MKRKLYCYLAAALVHFIVFINLPGNENFLRADLYFGGFMVLAGLLLIPVYPLIHFIRLCMDIWSGEGRELFLPLLSFLITFFLALWVSNYFVRTPTKLNAEGSEKVAKEVH
jgi:hypothetical protein